MTLAAPGMFNIAQQSIGLINNVPVIQYTITNPSGVQVSILNYGATVSGVITPDKEGNMGDVVLGFNSLEGFLQEGNPYFGSLIGRYSNRIAKARFPLDGKTYILAANNNGNSLHGGNKGFDKVLWHTEINGNNSLKMTYLSKDGEEGYPGSLHVQVIYSLTEDNELSIDYTATADQPTPVNLTNHSYFNLSAGSDPDVLDHVLVLNADKYLPVNDSLIPTGHFREVKGTPMDFRTEKAIGMHIREISGGGYDHTWVLNKEGENDLERAASVYHPASRRFMEVFTTEPGIQFYSGNFLDGTLTHTKNGRKYGRHAGLCLEAQHFPDSPNQPDFPDTILRPGETYRQVTVYKFGVRK